MKRMNNFNLNSFVLYNNNKSITPYFFINFYNTSSHPSSFSSLKFFSTSFSCFDNNINKEIMVKDPQFRYLLNFFEIEHYTSIEKEKSILKYIEIFKILQDYMIYYKFNEDSKSFDLNNVDFSYSYDDINEKYDYFKFLLQYYLKENVCMIKKKDLNLINNLLKDVENININKQDFTSKNIINISKQSVFLEFSPVYQSIDELLKESKDSYNTQLEIENLLNLAWIEVLNKKIGQLDGQSLKSESFSLLHDYVTTFDNCIDYIRDEKQIVKKYTKDLALKPLYELKNTEISAIVFNILLPVLYNIEGSPRNLILMQIGEKIFNRWSYLLFKKHVKLNPKSNNFSEFKSSLNITSKDIGNLGDLLLHHVLKIGDFLELDIKKEFNKNETWIVPSEKGIKLFEKNFDLIGFKLPMLCPPVKWDENQEGGYLLNNQYKFDSLIHQSVNNVTPTIIEENNEIYNQINYMSSIPFKINKKILKLILDEGIEKGLILGSLHKDTDKIKELSLLEKQKVLAHNSRYYQERNILGIAQLFSNVEKFYFPLFYDWRGRIYTDTSYLNYQSIPLAKALLEFADGKSLLQSYENMPNNTDVQQAIFWLKVYGANCYGNGDNKNLDKLSYIDRVIWIENNHNNIISLDPNFWTKANEPLLFLAFCYEYKAYNENSYNFITHLPIQLDATCNGIQHLSIISANSKLAKLVNLLPNNIDQKPFDLYSVALEEIKKNINKTIDDYPLYIRLKNLNLDRQIVKRSIMTIPYNVTVNGIVEQLKEFFYFEKIDDQYLYLPKNPKHGTKYIGAKDLFKLASIIHNVLYEAHPELKNVVTYFENMVNLLTKLDLPVIWITPAGLKIKQKYALKKSTRIRSGLYKGADYTIVIPTNKIDKLSQKSAFMPNLIHSMDGSTITLLIKNLRSLGLFNIYTIHDCFATTADNISIINELVREAFCEIYSDENFLINLHTFFLEYISGNYKIVKNYIITSTGPIEIPKLPKTGDFNDLKENIKKAIYLIN